MIPRRRGLPKLSDGLKNFAAEKFRASRQRMFSVGLVKRSSDEGHLPSALAVAFAEVLTNLLSGLTG